MSAPTSRYGSAGLPAEGKGTIGGKLIAIGSIVFVIFAGFTVYGFLQRTSAENLKPTVISFARPAGNPTTIDVTIDVTRKDPTVPAYCIVNALNYDKAEVGRREFLVPASGDKVQRFSMTIPSRGVPVVAKMYGCSEKIPAYLTRTAQPAPTS